MIKHGNISVFVPHIGCPNRCSFCNQFKITGSDDIPHKEQVKNAVETAVNSKGYNPNITELAFFGGSFTAIERGYMTELLKAGYEFVKNGVISGIRVSTRPDAIDDEICGILVNYGVTAVELGCQSLVDEVLAANFRGHTAKDVENASKTIKNYGMSLGLQMMTGLYKDTDKGALYTADKIIEYGADTVRIYPTLVLENTYLGKLFKENKYCPQTLEEAVNLSADLLIKFEIANVNVIRVGLHSVDEKSFLGGPWHPAFGELCQSRVMLKKLLAVLEEKNCKNKTVNVFVEQKNLSKMIGQKKSNIEILRKMGYNCNVYASDCFRVEIV